MRCARRVGRRGVSIRSVFRIKRADVLQFLLDTTGTFQGSGAHQVKLPDGGTGHATPSTAGASLVTRFRDSDGKVVADVPAASLHEDLPFSRFE